MSLGESCEKLKKTTKNPVICKALLALAVKNVKPNTQAIYEIFISNIYAARLMFLELRMKMQLLKDKNAPSKMISSHLLHA